MRNFITIGSLSVRVSRKGIAKWGYPLIRAGGLSLFSRDSGGDITIASYHPRNCATWHWAVGLRRRKEGGEYNAKSVRALHRTGQWHDYYRLGRRYDIRVSQQDYHKQGASNA